MSLPTDAPVLTTERLILRAHGLGDFADGVAMWSDPAVTRYITGRPSTGEEVWARILRYAGSWRLLGFGYWAITERATGRFLGEGGFHDLKRDFQPPFEGAPEIGWGLIPEAHGKGLAYEATRAMLEWSDAMLDDARTVCLIGPENAASLKLADKLGYREYARTGYRGEPVILFDRPRGGRAA
ncbi:MAG TPA: GNAT family N-acetyltransferase [Caulobacteraceae bacterium]|jgi:RimJ/RimL family protein N-acetyltransferase